jgi:hypothetical protein
MMGESIGIALQVYFLGFVIALAMAFLIKIILFIIRRGNKPVAEKASAPAVKEDKEPSDKSKPAEIKNEDRGEGAA